MQIYYKVVKIFRGRENVVKTSAVLPRVLSKLTIVYKENEWVHADPILLNQGLGLCVFDCLRHALNLYKFLNRFEEMELWECDIVEMDGIKPSGSLNYDSFNMNWSDMQTIGEKCHGLWPCGTVLVESVRLRKKLK